MSTTETPSLTANAPEGTIYTRAFWLAYAANVSLVAANALTFRFAELVAWLGGTEKVAGAIVSVGMIGAIAARFLLGQAIDRYGTSRLWLLSSLMFLFGCGLFLLSGRLAWEIYLARISFSIGLAGMFTCSMVHIQNQVPPHRRTEAIGSLGTSGFVGMITGTQVGDWIFNTLPPGEGQFLALFGGATALGVFYLVTVVCLTRRDVHQPPSETPAAHRLIFRYWPGPVVFVAMLMGVGFAVTTVFLTRFATQQNLGGIGTFFTAYALSAFLVRIGSRDWSNTYGRHRMILMGLTGHFVGFSLLPLVTRDWHLLFPAMGCGFAHALLFPAVVSLGSGAFPRQYRGTGTTIVLGFSELGAMLSAPALGWIIDHFGFQPMFHTAAATALLVAFGYALTAARVPDADALCGRPHPSTGLAIAIDGAGASDDDGESSDEARFPHLGRSA